VLKKVGLYLMTEKGFQTLNSICAFQHYTHISFVCIGKDKNVENDYSEEIKSLCVDFKIRFFYNSESVYEDQTADWYIAVSWRWLILKENLIVLHDSLLPKYRGFAPLVSSLINGEPKIGVTALFASEEYDKGDIIAQRSIEIKYPMKIAKAIEIVSKLYVEIINFLFQKIINNQPLVGEKQEDLQSSYSLWLDESDYFIDWNKSASEICRKVDACGYPFNYAKMYYGDRIVNLISVVEVADVVIENRTPGKIIFINQGLPTVVCKVGLLQIVEASYVDNKESLLPLNKFRVRFT